MKEFCPLPFPLSIPPFISRPLNPAKAYEGAQNSSDNLPSYLQTTIIAQMLSTVYCSDVEGKHKK